ncbi:galactose oxidase [Paraburkholderia sp. MM5496-R1]|uniref:galactose oxidase-like domain-containing protein n=2 Tax=Paraburkholderia TaxID=1822464 RepID=UPI003D195784
MKPDRFPPSHLKSSATGKKALALIVLGAMTIATCEVATAQTAPPSQWSAPISVPLVPVAAANLPNGKVLVWSADSPLDFTGGEVNLTRHENNRGTYTAIFDPVAGTSTQLFVTNIGHDMFCPGIANLPNGDIFVTGGSTSAKVSAFNTASGHWTVQKPMNIPRAYQGSVTLSNGDVFVLGGSWNGGLGGKSGETWSKSGWREDSAVTANLGDPDITNDAEGIFRADNHMWLFADSNGTVFHAGPSRAMQWISTAGTGSISAPVNRGADNDAMTGNAVMYDVRRILAVGGAPNYGNDYATSNATLIDISNGGASTRTVAPMNYQRAYANSVALPDGEVVVVGGQTYALPFSDDNAVLTPEIWSPATESFTPLAPQAVPRTYHSVALLLPDGRVLSGGGGLCGGCATNHPNVEILTPPYLLNADGSPASRPTILSAPSNASLGSSISVSTDRAVSAFSMMRLSSATHSLNNEQRRVPLSFGASKKPGQYELQIPGDSGVAVPGYYMLFALDANGVPSVSTTIRIH